MADEFATPGLDISLRDYIDLARRRRAIILQALIAVTAGGFALNLTKKPVYHSSTRVLLEGKNFSVAQYDANNPISGLLTQDSGHDITTQIEVIQGEQVLNDAFDEAGIPRGSAKVVVTPVDKTDLIDIAVESSLPKRAEQLAKVLPKTYLRYVNGSRRTELASALAFSQARLSDENRILLEGQLKLQKVRQRSHIYSVSDDRKSRSSGAAAAYGEFEKAQISVAGTEALLTALVNQRRAEQETILATTSTPNPDYAAIKAKIAGLQAQKDTLLVLYKPNSSKVEVLDAQMEALRVRLNSTPPALISQSRKKNPTVADLDKKISAARVDLASSQVKLRSLQARAEHAERALLGFDANEMQQELLESTVANARSNVALFTKTVEDLSLRSKAAHDPVTVVTPAGPAVKNDPHQIQTLVFAVVAGLVIGVILALVQEYLDDRVNSAEDLRDILPAPALGFVPLIERENARILSPDSEGSVLECYRVLRSNVRFATVDAPSSSLLLSSAVPGEGKSVTAVNLAIALALDGVRVILVDLDLRRPTVHKKLSLRQSPGVTNVLVGHTAIGNALQDTEIPGLRILASGPLPPNPAELLNSKAMTSLHSELKDWADVVVIDGPPFLATADSQVLSAMVDGVIFVAHLGVVKKPAVRHVRNLLDQSRGKLLGVVFNKIDLSDKRDDYYYGYYRYYSEYQTDGQGRRRRASTTEYDNLLVQVRSQEIALAPGASRNNSSATKSSSEEKDTSS